MGKVCKHLPLVAVLGLGLAAGGARGQDSRFKPEGQQIPNPPCLTKRGAWEGASAVCTEGTHAAWLKDIRHWRDERRIRIGYDGTRYALPATAWTQTSFMQPQLMVHDRYFYDAETGKYTVGRYLGDLEKRYGGIDAVLIWPTYPNMGIDARNQHDMIRSMPGGVAGVREMVAEFHRHGVRVLFPMMMWDQGTHDPGKPWPEAIAELMKEIGADGVNGDTQDGVPLAFTLAADRVGHPLVFEPEGSPHDEGLAWNLMTWGQYKFAAIPEVDRFKWLEPRHMVNISDRWARDKTDDLQFAFFNGVGVETWENVWGIWNGLTPRDAEATRRVATTERGVASLLASAGWEPHAPMLRAGVFASRWPGAGKTVWTIVNRNEYGVEGAQMSVPEVAGVRYFDVYHGVELTPERRGGEAVLSFGIEAHGFGAVLATMGTPDAKDEGLLRTMREMTARPLASYSKEWAVLPQTMMEVPATKAAASAALVETAAGALEGMVRVPAGEFRFKVEGIEIEGSNDVGVDVQYPWEETPRRFHDHAMQVKAFYIAKFPVTNAEFKRFLDEAHYRPADALNFLRDWKDGSYPAGWGNKPVTWVSIEDARAYARWAGMRLPHEWEWQRAAQGMDGRRYPWGEEWKAGAVPVPDQGRSLRGPDDVDAHPAGASALGVMDLVGNVWQWTDEFRDEHTRAGIVRGGSYYQPQGSVWYFPQAYRNDQHGKVLLMGPSLDRSGAVGFRCVQDAE